MTINYELLLLGISIKEDWGKVQLRCLGVDRAYEAIGKEVDVADFQRFLDLQDSHVNELEFRCILNGGEIIQKSARKKGVRMPFGKYKGQKISDIPVSYLEWLKTIPNYKLIKIGVRREIDKSIGIN